MKNCLIVAALAALGCSPSAEAPRVKLPVSASAGVSVSSNELGWLVTITTARLALTNLEFTTEGEAHVATLWNRASDMVVPAAYAHPGHLAGGEVIGELPGTFVADFVNGGELGQATLIESHYDGANITFAQSDELGGSFELTGTAVSGDVEVLWTATVTQDLTRTIVGLPMSLDLPDSTVTGLEVQFLPVNPKDDTVQLFAGIDFGVSPELEITPESENGARLLRATQRHEFWRVAAVR